MQMVMYLKLIQSCFTNCSHGKKVQVGKDQEKAQSERNSHSKSEVGKTKHLVSCLVFAVNL